MNALQSALARKNQGRPPVWFMRQAGRYHSHYQNLKKTHSFMELCKKPELACEVTMGPIRDFGFDAAILFSDLLFPLEALGMGLTYDPGPKLERHLLEVKDVEALEGRIDPVRFFSFQAQALKKIRATLPAEKGLIGFVGGPFTLFAYAVEGSHSGELLPTRAGLIDGRYSAFLKYLSPLLVENMVIQARAGAETVALFDTCAGELSSAEFATHVVPPLAEVLAAFKLACPATPVTYYSRGTGPEHWSSLRKLPISCLGVDWNHDLAQVLRDWAPTFAVQGNIDPQWLFLEPKELEERLREVFSRVRALPKVCREGWICGLGHGVLQKTPEANVHLFLKLQKEIFA